MKKEIKKKKGKKNQIVEVHIYIHQLPSNGCGGTGNGGNYYPNLPSYGNPSATFTGGQ